MFNIRNPHYLFDTKKIYVGEECVACLKSNNVSDGNISMFKNNCIQFYQTSAEEIQKRFFENNIFKDFCFLSPEVALEPKGRDTIPNLQRLSQHFGDYGIENSELELEWRNLPFMVTSSLKEKYYTLTIDEHWFENSKIKNFEDKYAFLNLSKLAKIIASLPHSNAAAERIFSIVTDVKSKSESE
ncbi:hypothetical protein TcasGA2_TC010096 [Tribolium castaneum]|uniref:HAT C-terminal dimerisation domain-containing protein n=1 Tax=Tribolium castaneum TaxID=7070 RepID=D6WS92_TRICA|nr:hypothetical protein TcasGA2_TC010096 [Tribolium castaneum]